MEIFYIFRFSFDRGGGGSGDFIFERNGAAPVIKM